MINYPIHKVQDFFRKGLGIAILIWGIAYAQIPNGGFEILTGACTPSNYTVGTDATAPFQEGCVPYWYASHGTPQIVEYPDGNRAALLWAGDFDVTTCPYNINDGGEGIMMHCNFLRGEKYTISMDIRTEANPPNGSHPGFDHTLVYLANGMTPRWDINYCPGETDLYEIPYVADKQLAFHETDFYSDPFVTRVFTIQPNDDYEWLWILPQEAGRNRILVVDNVRLVTDCLDYQIYSNTSSLPTLTKRAYFIFAYQDVKVLPSQDVTFEAGNYVQMDPGFVAETGSVFLAHIVDDCDKLECGNWDPEEGEGGEGGEGGSEKRVSEELPEVTVFPNPGNGNFNLNFPQGEEYRFMVQDVGGRIIRDFRTAGGEAKLDLNDQTSGIYFLRWQTPSGQSGSQKLIKQ